MKTCLYVFWTLLALWVHSSGVAQEARPTNSQESLARGDRNREAIECQLERLARRAMEHYNRPADMQGGEGAFDASRYGNAWTLPAELDTTANAAYVVVGLASEHVTIIGVGFEDGADRDYVCANGVNGKVQVTCIVTGDRFVITKNN